MGDTSIRCSVELQEQTRAFERVLGHWLPYCSAINTARGGEIVARPVNTWGLPASSLQMIFSTDGGVAFSESDSIFLSSQGFTFERLRFSQIDPQRFREVRALLLFAEDLRQANPMLKRRYGIRE